LGDCIFCKIAAGELGKLMHQDGEIAAFRDINPAGPVHILIVPREHVPGLGEGLDDPGLVGRMAELAGTLSEIRGRLDREVNCASAEKNVLSLSVRMADDREWSSWKQSFKPFRLGTRMLVTPTWEEPDALPEDIVIRIDPGQAFGTGQHATTASCAFMLERYIEGGERVLDVGTGTGILAIASVLLGADEATGVDIDSTAVKCAAENAAANRVSDRVKIVKGDMLKGMDGPYDIIVSNILADPVIEIAPTAFRLLCSGGYYITAGYVLKSEEDVSKALTGAGFEIADRIQDGDWVSLAARKPTL